LVNSRSIPVREADMATDEDEPLLELAKRKIRQEGGSLRLTLRSLRAERRKRAVAKALKEAPKAVKDDDGKYKRVSSDPRWPFGIENELVIAPFGLAECGLPRTQDPALKKRPSAATNAVAKQEARDLIQAKLERLGCDPIAIMAEIALDKEGVKAEVRLRAAVELSTMLYPRLRSTEQQQRIEKTTFVFGVPTERPATVNDWLATAAGNQRSVESVSTVIEGVIVSEET